MPRLFSVDYANDLWQFDSSISTKIFLQRSEYPGSIGQYGNLGVAEGSNMPGSRTGHTMVFTGKSLLLFAGYVYATTSTTGRRLKAYIINSFLLSDRLLERFVGIQYSIRAVVMVARQ